MTPPGVEQMNEVIATALLIQTTTPSGVEQTISHPDRAMTTDEYSQRFCRRSVRASIDCRLRHPRR